MAFAEDPAAAVGAAALEEQGAAEPPGVSRLPRTRAAASLQRDGSGGMTARTCQKKIRGCCGRVFFLAPLPGGLARSPTRLSGTSPPVAIVSSSPNGIFRGSLRNTVCWPVRHEFLCLGLVFFAVVVPKFLVTVRQRASPAAVQLRHPAGCACCYITPRKTTCTPGSRRGRDKKKNFFSCRVSSARMTRAQDKILSVSEARCFGCLWVLGLFGIAILWIGVASVVADCRFNGVEPCA